MLETTSYQKMSKGKLVGREDIIPVDASLETLEEVVNDLETQFVMGWTVNSSSHQECVRIFHHVRSTMMYYQFGRAPVSPETVSQ